MIDNNAAVFANGETGTERRGEERIGKYLPNSFSSFHGGQPDRDTFVALLDKWIRNVDNLIWFHLETMEF